MSKSTWPAHRLTHCLFVAWLHLKCYRDSDSTKVATVQQPRRWPKRSSPLQDPRKRLWFFFFWISHCQLCELLRPGGNIQRCLREQVSQRWNPEVRSRSYNRDTGAVLVQRAVRILSRIMYELEVCSDGTTEAQPRSFRQNRPTASTLSDIMQVQHMSRKIRENAETFPYLAKLQVYTAVH